MTQIYDEVLDTLRRTKKSQNVGIVQKWRRFTHKPLIVMFASDELVCAQCTAEKNTSNRPVLLHSSLGTDPAGPFIMSYLSFGVFCRI